MVIEVMTFRLRSGASEAEFLAADRRVQAEFAYQQPGMVRRTTGRGHEGDWVVVDLWRSAAHADACLDGWHRDPAPRAFMAFVDEATVRVQRFETLD
ncbi:MAG: hypothetical protein J2P40_14650 [Candidatus Dormibacteraeota bacterium]|nr:hypothetical protein [Candidatus Dormibacteraeota bacterium]MBO0762512.1 hypothetical protein [Candidatus Dormibacteraeota bacterium]